MSETRVQTGMHVDPCQLGVIQAGAAHGLAVQLEAERPHEVQRAAGIRAQADDVAGIRRNLRLEENHMKHEAADRADRDTRIT